MLNSKRHPETVKYQALMPLLLNEVQKQEKTIAGQQKQIEALTEQVAENAAMKKQFPICWCGRRSLSNPSWARKLRWLR